MGRLSTKGIFGQGKPGARNTEACPFFSIQCGECVRPRRAQSRPGPIWLRPLPKSKGRRGAGEFLVLIPIFPQLRA